MMMRELIVESELETSAFLNPAGKLIGRVNGKGKANPSGQAANQHFKTTTEKPGKGKGNAK
jgi:hypothetical protein